MSQPVKLSNQLVLDARLTGTAAKRSIAGQIEFWAGLGRAVETVLRGSEVVALQNVAARPLSEVLREVGTPIGDRRLADVLAAQPYPHYTPALGAPGLLMRVSENGTETLGRFVNKKFVAAKPASRKK